MAEKWKDGDSARTMTRKYNELVDELKSLVGIDIKAELKEVYRLLDTKVGKITKEDIGLENVDNTSDEDKPVSLAVRQAINRAVAEMITSEPFDPDQQGDESSEPVITPELIQKVEELKQEIEELKQNGGTPNKTISVNGNKLVITI